MNHLEQEAVAVWDLCCSFYCYCHYVLERH